MGVAGDQTENYTIQWLGKMRRMLRRLLDSPPFAGNEITEEEYERWADANFSYVDEVHAFYRVRHEECRRFRIPPGKQELFNRVEQLFDLIQKAARDHSALRNGVSDAFRAQVMDDLTFNCINIGIHLAEVSRDLVHRQLSKPIARTTKLSDPAEAEAAEEEIKRQLRGSRNRSFTEACRLASSILMRDHEIKVSGKFLFERFRELDPKKQA